MKNKVFIAPSVLSADLLNLEDQVKELVSHGADLIHIDVMDGHFVPNLTFGPNMVAALKRIVDIPLDVHLMITNPEMYIEDYARAGAGILTVHQEVCHHLHRIIQQIHRQGMKAGVSLNPATPVALIGDIIKDVELVLIMSVNPGFGGQKFIPHTLDKLKAVKKMAEKAGKQIMIEVDGGINPDTAKQSVKNGANVLVAGNAIFKQPDKVAAMNAIKKAVLY